MESPIALDPLLDNVNHIFFDLDHTLWDFDANSREALTELFALYEVVNMSGSSADEFIAHYFRHNERCWDLYRQNRLSKSRLRHLRFENAFADIGIRDRKFARTVANAYLESCPRKTKLNDGALEVLENLSAKFKLHILSNGFHEVQLCKLDASGISGFFHEVITSERAGAKKPNAKIFEYALTVTGAKAIESLMIGDHLEIDVHGAQNAGWKAIHYCPGNEKGLGDSIQHLSEIIGLLQS